MGRVFICVDCLHEQEVMGYNVKYPIRCELCGGKMYERYIYHPPDRKNLEDELLKRMDIWKKK